MDLGVLFVVAVPLALFIIALVISTLRDPSPHAPDAELANPDLDAVHAEDETSAPSAEQTAPSETETPAEIVPALAVENAVTTSDVETAPLAATDVTHQASADEAKETAAELVVAHADESASTAEQPTVAQSEEITLATEQPTTAQAEGVRPLRFSETQGVSITSRVYPLTQSESNSESTTEQTASTQTDEIVAATEQPAAAQAEGVRPLRFSETQGVSITSRVYPLTQPEISSESAPEETVVAKADEIVEATEQPAAAQTDEIAPTAEQPAVAPADENAPTAEQPAEPLQEPPEQIDPDEPILSGGPLILPSKGSPKFAFDYRGRLWVEKKNKSFFRQLRRPQLPPDEPDSKSG